MQRSASPSKMTPQSSFCSRTNAAICSRASDLSGFGEWFGNVPSSVSLMTIASGNSSCTSSDAIPLEQSTAYLKEE